MPVLCQGRKCLPGWMVGRLVASFGLQLKEVKGKFPVVWAVRTRERRMALNLAACYYLFLALLSFDRHVMAWVVVAAAGVKGWSAGFASEMFVFDFLELVAFLSSAAMLVWTHFVLYMRKTK